MGIVYNVYANDGHGGPVNYATPIATTTALSFKPPALAAPSDSTFVVRAFDTTVGLEEANTDARVRIVVDAGGNDITARPNAPFALALRATAGGGCSASWSYNPAGQGGPPTGFYAYLSPGTSPSYASPAATVPYVAGLAGYSCELSGLVDGTTSTIAVRAFNSAGIGTNTTAVASITGDSTPPTNVDALAASPTFQG
ncbi:MAG TPA: hypothetical protein VG406_14230 [Isosphaeraceae bacterium]|jgi:hypothetical protein|nr:hypothetical protein [Isosphaeraceae bacterium]